MNFEEKTIKRAFFDELALLCGGVRERVDYEKVAELIGPVKEAKYLTMIKNLAPKAKPPVLTTTAINDLVPKVAAVSEQEARKALDHLQELDAVTPSKSDLARGAVAGGIVGGTGRILSGAVGGELKTPTMSAIREAGSALGKAKQFVPLGRQLGASLIPGALVGAALPTLKQKMTVEAEKEKIRQHLGVGDTSERRSKIRQTLGV